MPAPPAEVARTVRDATMEVVATLELGGETIDVHGKAFPDAGMVQAVLSVPHGDAHYELILKVRGPRRCGIDSAEAVRDLVLRTLALNEDTDFAP